MKRTTTLFLSLGIAAMTFGCKSDSGGSGEQKESSKDTTQKEKSTSQKEEKKDGPLRLDVPKPSPLGKVHQKVGLTDIKITYSRPGVKGRKIFGGLVPYDEIWRTGANASTKLEVSTPVTIKGNKISEGKYALFTIPSKNDWTIIISNDTESGKDGIEKSEDAARFKVSGKDHHPKVETFTINVTDIRMDSANIQLLWENTSVKFPIETPTDKMVEKQIKEKLPKAKDDNGMIFYQAAEYYHRAGKDLEQALTWVNKALKQKETYWMLHRKAEILAELGRYEEAIETAKHSKELAKKGDSNHYIRLNEKKIKKWSEKK